ncbi:HPr family phosphocarrier protein [Corynebacterium epidermidicanis]|uniref:Phosphocarrier protein HPr n=1 Tax=Corynebacterium epidermidicanis TaxID=1050174 RepID=A0A0G3GUX4_9CORY|nr:HPr family phosphocarrier protein [Corynebacterium epidermidicanis]AKK03333.1 phosphotransferase system HPr (HPr) family protein [Corynebacterium epidermidicanis]
MKSIKVKVAAATGLHARPATVIAEAAAEFDEDIFIALVDNPDDDEPADASSSLMIMALGAEKDDEVIVTSEDDAAAEKIAELIASDLDA